MCKHYSSKLSKKLTIYFSGAAPIVKRLTEKYPGLVRNISKKPNCPPIPPTSSFVRKDEINMLEKLLRKDLDDDMDELPSYSQPGKEQKKMIEHIAKVMIAGPFDSIHEEP